MHCPPTVRRSLGAAAALAALLLAARPAAAQRPDAHWRTLATPHFRVHFAPETESVARHAAVSAEWAYAALSRELVPPRGPIELVVSDDADFSNGFTTTFPTNRVVVYTRPPVDDPELRDYDDWITLVVTHELTHVFHLDRARGVWRAAQYVFGRNPYLFPAAYEPRWVSEGLAVYFESRITGTGRIVGTGHRAVARAAALGGRSPRLGDLSLARTGFPGGGSVYVFGSLIFDELARTRGEAGIRRYVEYTSAYILPFQLNATARASFGESFSAALRAVRDSVLRGVDPARPPLIGWRAIAGPFDDLRDPRRRGERIVFGADPGREMPGAYEVDEQGALRRLGRRTAAGPNVPLANGDLLTAQLEYASPYEIRSDLYVQHGRRLHRLTRGARLDAPDARADGEIVAVQSVPGTTVLARVSRDGRVVRAITAASADTQWAQPRWSPDGQSIVAVRLVAGGRSQIVVVDTAGLVGDVLADDQGSVSASPSWTADGRSVLYTSDRTGTAQVYEATVVPHRVGGTTVPVDAPVSTATTALAAPLELRDGTDALPGSRRLAAAELRADGWTLGIGDARAAPTDHDTLSIAAGPAPHAAPPKRPALPTGSDSSPARPYSAFRQLLPRYWLPIAYAPDDSTTVYGAMTSGSDVVGRHAYFASAQVATRWDERSGSLAYQWAGLGMPVLGLAASQDWDGAGTVYSRATGDILGAVRRRTRTLSGGFSWTRPRTRYALAARASGGVESRDYLVHPESLAGAFTSDLLRRTHRRPFVLGSLAGANTQSPRRSISAENGLAAFVSAQRLWDRDESGGGHTRAIGSLAGYAALDLPGYAHHVLALRVSGGWSDSEDPTEFSVGGAQSELAALGSPADGGTSDFPLRGYLSGALVGTRALTGSLEYRAPLFIPARGLSILFFDRTSLSLFADAATAWCGARAQIIGCRAGSSPGTPLVSVGGELVFDLAIFYDAPLTLRLGAAKSVGRYAGAPFSSDGAYLALGRSF